MSHGPNFNPSVIFSDSEKPRGRHFCDTMRRKKLPQQHLKKLSGDGIELGLELVLGVGVGVSVSVASG